MNVFVHLKNVVNMLVDPQPNTFVKMLPKLKMVPAAQSGSKTSGNRELGKAESGSSIQALNGSCRRRAVRKCSLPLTGQADRSC